MKENITPQQAKFMLVRLQLSQLDSLWAVMYEALKNDLTDSGVAELRKSFDEERKRLESVVSYQERIGGKL